MDFKNTIHASLGIETVEFTKDKVVLSMPVSPKNHQPMGYLHGGASVVLAESAASMGTLLHLDPKKETAVGIEINANHLKSKKDGIVRAVASPIHKGRTIMVWNIEILDEEDELICICRSTIGIVTKKKDG